MNFKDIPMNKTILARLFARENLTVCHRNVKSAMIDLKNRTLYLPFWENLNEFEYEMLTSHEAGHALHTPAGAFHDNETQYRGLMRTYINIIEDARIEKMMLVLALYFSVITSR